MYTKSHIKVLYLDNKIYKKKEKQNAILSSSSQSNIKSLQVNPSFHLLAFLLTKQHIDWLREALGPPIFTHHLFLISVFTHNLQPQEDSSSFLYILFHF